MPLMQNSFTLLTNTDARAFIDYREIDDILSLRFCPCLRAARLAAGEMPTNSLPLDALRDGAAIVAVGFDAARSLTL